MLSRNAKNVIIRWENYQVGKNQLRKTKQSQKLLTDEIRKFKKFIHFQIESKFNDVK